MAAVDFPLDTDVMIEFLRGREEAAAWLAAQGERVPGIPYVVALELLRGARNSAEMRALRARLQGFALVGPTEEDGALAVQLLAEHALPDGCGPLDCLIGALAVRAQVPLYTFNAKHLAVLEGVDARQPYDRRP